MESRVESLEELHQVSEIVREATARRNALILAARLDGWALTAIAEAAGLSQPGISAIVTRANGGTPPIPRQKQKPSFK